MTSEDSFKFSRRGFIMFNVKKLRGTQHYFKVYVSNTKAQKLS